METVATQVVKTSITKGRNRDKHCIEGAFCPTVAWDEVRHQNQGANGFHCEGEAIGIKEKVLVVVVGITVKGHLQGGLVLE